MRNLPIILFLFTLVETHNRFSDAVTGSNNEWHFPEPPCECKKLQQIQPQQQSEAENQQQINLLIERINILLTNMSLNNAQQQTVDNQKENRINIIETICADLLKEQQQFESKLQHIENMLTKQSVERSTFPKNCIEATQNTRQSGVYEIVVPHLSAEPFQVYCNNDVDYGGWLVIQRRVDGSEDFNRNWADYKKGFGNLRGEFFIGLDKLHALTNSMAGKQELYILMESDAGVTKHAKYSAFAIGNEAEDYYLQSLGSYSGDASNAFIHHLSRKFSTKDHNNNADTWIQCPETYNAGWWYQNCYTVLLNGLYFPTKDDGIQWDNFSGRWTKLKFAEMMIRPSNVNRL